MANEVISQKRLLIVSHAPSPNTLRLCRAVVDGVLDSSSVEVVVKPPLEAGVEDVFAANALILGTPENLGYMSGALKDFFDRIYYPCLDRTRGLSCALYIRAGQSAGSASRRSIEIITTALGWRMVQEPLILSGPYSDEFVQSCTELGQAMAAGLDTGIF